MPFTEAQEKVIKEALPDIYKQLEELQTQVAKLLEEKQDLTELLKRMESFENWRTALRMRIRTENSTI